MNLGIFLSPGESLSLYKKNGQDGRFVNLYLKNYLKEFKKIYLFSYENESNSLPKNVILIPNTSKLQRYLYALLLPIIHKNIIDQCDGIRGFGLSSSISAILTNKPFVVNWAYDYISFAKIEKKYIYIPVYFILEKIAFLRAHKVFVATKAKFKNLKGKKFIYLPNGVDTNLFTAKSKTKNGIVYVGRLEKQKNLFFLISSISQLPKIYREITFIGAGSLKDELASFAQSNYVDLKIIPPVPNKKLPNLLSNFSILALTSLQEGSPKVLLEAMSLGLVPVATNFPTAREFITDYEDGFITGFEKKEFSEKILTLFKNQMLLNKMSQKARNKIIKDFNLENLLKKEIRIIKGLHND